MNGRQEANEMLVESLIRNLYTEDMPKIYNDFLLNLVKEKQPVTAKSYLHWTKIFLEYIAKKRRMKLKNITPSTMSKITTKDIQQYLDVLESELKNDKGEKKSRERARLTWHSLNCFFKYLLSKHLIKTNPMLEIKCPKRDKRKPKNYLNTSEIKNVLSIIESDIKLAEDDETKAKELQNLLVIETLLTTGIRARALTQIKITDFDLFKKQLTVIDKGEKFFTYDLSERYIKDLRRYLRQRKKLLNGRNVDYLFLSERTEKGMMNYQTVYNIVTEKTRRAGNEVSPHRLRATYGRTIYNETGDIFLTQQMMGHSHWQTTMLYLDTVTEERKKLANSIVTAAVFQS